MRLYENVLSENNLCESIFFRLIAFSVLTKSIFDFNNCQFTFTVLVYTIAVDCDIDPLQIV